MTKKSKLIILVFGFLGVIIAANFALAADFGFNEVGNGLSGSLAITDPRMVVGRVIQIILSFLGAIAVLLVMYAGFLWMTSDGDEEKITRAKGILRNAIIGLIIILSSWAIATFVLSQLINAIGGGGSNNIGGGGGLSNSGAGAIGSCSIESNYPTNGQLDVPRNTSIMVTFKEQVKTDMLCTNNSGTVCVCNNTYCNRINPEAIHIYKTDLGDLGPSANVTDILLMVASDNKTLILTPLSFLGSSNGNTPYSVKFNNQVKKLDGSSMFKNCSADYAEWGFTVNDKLDLTPPLVSPAGIFPLPDNEKDIYRSITPAKAASGSIIVNSCPKIFVPAQFISVDDISGTPGKIDATVILNYHGPISKFQVSVPADTPTKAQLFDSSNNLLGSADFNSAGEVVFVDYFTFIVASHPAGSLWEINTSPEQLADTLIANDTVYTFAASAENNNIEVPAVCDKNIQAANIQAKLSGHSDIEVSLAGNVIGLKAKVAGLSGNNIVVATTNTAFLAISPLAGGSDLVELTQAKDKKDRPMNSAIQINFNEAINPLTISGSASEVDKYIRVVNADASSSPAGMPCSNNIDCRSYKCENNSCVGNYLGGNFLVSNGYRTLEFISDRECGLNGCGEKIYCLPANSHLAVELMAADLKSCNSDNDCLAYSPFKTCSSTPLSYKTCQNKDTKNYPSADIAKLNGIIDAATNSLDGDRNTFADGPYSFYNDNYNATSTVNTGAQDKYKWSFYINDQIMLNPPQITAIKPIQGQGGISLSDPIEVSFNTLMLNSSLRSGSVLVNNGTSTTEHKLVNLRSSSPSPLGYWILNNNIDTPPLDGEPDLTIAKIWHSPLKESVTYKSQVGSGVKDIYQNCFKPSLGPGCAATIDKPSCCFGTETGILGADGNCK